MFEVLHMQKTCPVQLLRRIPSRGKYKQGPGLFTGLKCLGDSRMNFGVTRKLSGWTNA